VPGAIADAPIAVPQQLAEDQLHGAVVLHNILQRHRVDWCRANDRWPTSAEAPSVASQDPLPNDLWNRSYQIAGRLHVPSS
jgi:hypothetical protein